MTVSKQMTIPTDQMTIPTDQMTIPTDQDVYLMKCQATTKKPRRPSVSRRAMTTAWSHIPPLSLPPPMMNIRRDKTYTLREPVDTFLLL